MKKFFEQPSIRVQNLEPADILSGISSVFSIFNDESGDAISD